MRKQTAQYKTLNVPLHVVELAEEASRCLCSESVRLVYCSDLQFPWVVVLLLPVLDLPDLEVYFYVFDTTNKPYLSPWEDKFQEAFNRAIIVEDKEKVQLKLYTVRLRRSDDMGCLALHVIRNLSRLPDVPAMFRLLDHIEWGDPPLERYCGECDPNPDAISICRFQKIIDWMFTHGSFSKHMF